MHTRQYPLLLTLINSEHTKWFRITADDVVFLDELIEKHDQYSDNEGFRAGGVQGVAMRGGGPEHGNNVELQHMRGHLRHSAERTKELWQSDSYGQLLCAIPEEEKNHCRDEMKSVLPEQEAHIIPGNHVHASQEDIRTLVEKHFERPE